MSAPRVKAVLTTRVPPFIVTAPLAEVALVAVVAVVSLPSAAMVSVLMLTLLPAPPNLNTPLPWPRLLDATDAPLPTTRVPIEAVRVPAVKSMVPVENVDPPPPPTAVAFRWSPRVMSTRDADVPVLPKSETDGLVSPELKPTLPVTRPSPTTHRVAPMVLLVPRRTVDVMLARDVLVAPTTMLVPTVTVFWLPRMSVSDAVAAANAPVVLVGRPTYRFAIIALNVPS